MGDSPAVSMKEVADVLRRIAARDVEAFVLGGPIEPGDCGAVVIFADGFEISIYVDVGDLDYVEWAKAPDGRRSGFDDWTPKPQPGDGRFEDWELAAMRPELQLVGPLDLLSEKEQQALQKVGDGLWKYSG
ncbi:DUF7693 family protein [Dongia sp. agr-C8]